MYTARLAEISLWNTICTSFFQIQIHNLDYINNLQSQEDGAIMTG